MRPGVAAGSSDTRHRCSWFDVAFPLTPALSQGRGRIVVSASAKLAPQHARELECVPPSPLRERAGVRGNRTPCHPYRPARAQSSLRSAACVLLAAVLTCTQAVGAPPALRPVVEAEEDIYTYTNAEQRRRAALVPRLDVPGAHRRGRLRQRARDSPEHQAAEQLPLDALPARQERLAAPAGGPDRAHARAVLRWSGFPMAGCFFPPTPRSLRKEPTAARRDRRSCSSPPGTRRRPSSACCRFGTARQPSPSTPIAASRRTDRAGS